MALIRLCTKTTSRLSVTNAAHLPWLIQDLEEFLLKSKPLRRIGIIPRQVERRHVYVGHVLHHRHTWHVHLGRTGQEKP
jgi:hypothetical protein